MLIKKTLLNGAKDCWELWRVSSAWLYLSCLDNSNVLFAAGQEIVELDAELLELLQEWAGIGAHFLLLIHCPYMEDYHGKIFLGCLSREMLSIRV